MTDKTEVNPINYDSQQDDNISILPHKELYGNLTDLVLDVLRHIEQFGDHVEISNNASNLRLGWKCKLTQQTWLINLVKVKMLGIDSPDLISLFLVKAWAEIGNTTQWQLAIVQDPKLTAEIKRLRKMRIFW
jgi:hypothetical protein